MKHVRRRDTFWAVAFITSVLVSALLLFWLWFPDWMPDSCHLAVC